MKTILFSLLLSVLTSCYFQRPVQTQEPHNNKDYKVDYLFEHDGCKVYRFYDRGNDIYFTNCRGEVISVTDSTTIRNSINLRKQ